MDILELARSMQLTKPSYRVKFIIHRKTIFDPNSSRVQIRKKKKGKGKERSIGFQRLAARVRERDKIDYEHSSITILVEIAKLFKK